MNNDFSSLIASLNEEDDELTTFAETDQGAVLDWLPSLVPSFDKELQGGIPLSGQICEMYGVPSSGKSTFAGCCIANGQKMGVLPVYFDVEETQHSQRLTQLGVDPRQILTVKPKRSKNSKGEVFAKLLSVEDIGKKIVELANQIHDSNPNLTILFIWDSVAITMSDIDIDNQDSNVRGQQAKALAKITRILPANLQLNNASLLAFNQAREDLTAVLPQYASVKTTGGKAWEHALSVQILLSKKSKITKSSTDKTVIGRTTNVKVPKTKLGDNVDSNINVALLNETGFDIEYNIVLEGQANNLVSTGRNPKITIDEQHVLSGRNLYDLVMKLKDPDNFEYKKYLWQSLIKLDFPKGYPALFNIHSHMTVDKFPIIEGLRAYYYETLKDVDPRYRSYNINKYFRLHEENPNEYPIED